MVAAVVDVYNAAISAVRGKGRLAAITDVSREREECDIWYSIVRDTVHAGAHWGSCRATARLALDTTRDQNVAWAAGDPETTYVYSYELPSDYLRAWYLASGEPFEISYDSVSGARRLSTNAVSAVLVYARQTTDVTLWSPGETSAIIYGLAAHICGPITGQTGLQQLNIQLANAILEDAQTADSNTPEQPLDVIPPALIARGYSEGIPTSRYIYPYGQLFAAAVPNT